MTKRHLRHNTLIRKFSRLVRVKLRSLCYFRDDVLLDACHPRQRGCIYAMFRAFPHDVTDGLVDSVY